MSLVAWLLMCVHPGMASTTTQYPLQLEEHLRMREVQYSALLGELAALRDRLVDQQQPLLGLILGWFRRHSLMLAKLLSCKGFPRF
jgi:hypothetical protein